MCSAVSQPAVLAGLYACLVLDAAAGGRAFKAVHCTRFVCAMPRQRCSPVSLLLCRMRLARLGNAPAWPQAVGRAPERSWSYSQSPRSDLWQGEAGQLQ